jgi:hypothetical protein
MWYVPNRQAIEWFLDRCWPAIAARCPDLILRIVGPAPIEWRRRWMRVLQTEAPGFVEDLRAEYSRALRGGADALRRRVMHQISRVCRIWQEDHGCEGRFI